MVADPLHAMEPLNPPNEEEEMMMADVDSQDHQHVVKDAAFIQTVPMSHDNESHAMLAMQNTHLCYMDCNEKGLLQCAGLRVPCIRWMCVEHGVIAHKQHWCGGGGCGLRDDDKYCAECARRANRDSWIKLALILTVLAFIAVVLINKYS